MAQRHRAKRQVNIERQAHIFFAERHGELVIRAGEDGDARKHDLHAVLGAGLFVHLARDLDDHRVLDVCALDLAKRVPLERALDQAAFGAYNEEREVRHIEHTVHRAAERDLLADTVFDQLDRVRILFGIVNKFHCFNASLLQHFHIG